MIKKEQQKNNTKDLSPFGKRSFRRVQTKRWDAEGHIFVTECGEEKELIVVSPSLTTHRRLLKILKPGSTLNLLDCHSDEQETLHPEEIIFEPDFLVEITSLCACVQEHGVTAMTYILNLFKENNTTHHTLLGEAANLFLDECVNEQEDSPVTYNNSMSKFFREYPLQLTSADDIDADFFEATKKHFHNIQQTTKRLLAPLLGNGAENIHIEPSFFCPALGLQGRMDLLEGDRNNIIELK